MQAYGREMILDLHQCNKDNLTRVGIKAFFDDLCSEIDMNQCDMHFWDYDGDPEGYEEAPPHLRGVSAVQFITTSNVTIHTLDELQRVYLNVFSCKYFDDRLVEKIAKKHFGGNIVNQLVFERI